MIPIQYTDFVFVYASVYVMISKCSKRIQPVARAGQSVLQCGDNISYNYVRWCDIVVFLVFLFSRLLDNTHMYPAHANVVNHTHAYAHKTSPCVPTRFVLYARQIFELIMFRV